MDKIVHNSLLPEEQARLTQLQQELEGQELTVLLERIQREFGLSVNQIANVAGMDESALHKILKGENREFKAEHVDALLDDLEQHRRFLNQHERAIYQRALRVAAFLHFDLYKAIEPRLRRVEDPVKRIEALKEYLSEQYPALAGTYDKSGGAFPTFIPLIDVVARELNERWGWIQIPSGYQLRSAKGNRYHLISTDLFPKEITDLGPDLDIDDTGFGTYTIRRHIPEVHSDQAIRQSARSKMNYSGNIELVLIKPGEFLMVHEDIYAAILGRSQSVVDMPYKYWIGRFPVTNNQFTVFVRSTQYQTDNEKRGSEFSWRHHHKDNDELWGKGDHPVVFISWKDAQEFCKWLNKQHGSELPEAYVFRLPSEAEWEKAAGGPSNNKWPWGDEFDRNKCNTRERSKAVINRTSDGAESILIPTPEERKFGTTPVGSFSPLGDSPYGVADMAGNVWEWTQNTPEMYPYLVLDNEHMFDEDSERIVRGGSFMHTSQYATCGYRKQENARYGHVEIGFRVVVAPRIARRKKENTDLTNATRESENSELE